MDVNTLRVAVMLAGFVLFLALMLHTYSKSRRAEHDEAAQLPFQSDHFIDGDDDRNHPPHPGDRP
jgi:cbb3-type cytochrome oxidase subunit 3